MHEQASPGVCCMSTPLRPILPKIEGKARENHLQCHSSSKLCGLRGRIAILDVIIIKKFQNCAETKEEVHNVKVRSMESFASHEAAQELATKKTFRERNAVKITAPLCPNLSKQLQSIRSYKQYITDSLYDLNLLIQQKVRFIFVFLT